MYAKRRCTRGRESTEWITSTYLWMYCVDWRKILTILIVSSWHEIEALRAALERIGKAIDEEAAKCRGEDWSLMVGYVQACLEKLPGELEEWQKD